MSDNALAKIEEEARSQGQEIVRAAESFTITSQESVAQAAEYLQVIARKAKALEEQRTALVKPLNDHVASINDLFRVLGKPFKDARDILGGKVLAWKRLKDKEAEVERARKEAEEKAERERLAALNPATPAAPEAPELPRPAARVEKTLNVPGLSTKKEWKYRVVDFAKVPKDYLAIDALAVQTAIRLGLRDIPGLEIYQEESLAVRR